MKPLSEAEIVEWRITGRNPLHERWSRRRSHRKQAWKDKRRQQRVEDLLKAGKTVKALDVMTANLRYLGERLGQMNAKYKKENGT